MAIGEILLSQDKISEAQLEDALVHQKYFPGKTGSQLVELGFINPLELEEALSLQFGVPTAAEKDLKYLDETCRHLLPIEIIARYQLLPFKIADQCLSVAMTLPFDDEALGCLEKLTGQKELRIFCISEIRFHYYLFQHFREESEVRLRNVYLRYMKEKCKKALKSEKEIAGEESYLSEDPILDLVDALPAKLYTDPLELESLGLKPLGQNEELSGKNHEEWLQLQCMVQSQSKEEPATVQSLAMQNQTPAVPSPPVAMPTPRPPEYTPEFANLADFGV